MDKKIIKYEEAAEYREEIILSGWVCKTCGRLWGKDEHMARWCCATELPCDCGGRNDYKGYTCCSDCRDKHDKEKFLRRPIRKITDHELKNDNIPVLAEISNTYLFTCDEIEEYFLDHPEIKVEDFRIIECQPVKKPIFCMQDFMEDYYYQCDDYEAPDMDNCNAEDETNEYIDKLPCLWEGGKYRIDVVDLMKQLNYDHMEG